MRTYPDPFLRRWSRRLFTYTLVITSFIISVATVWIWAPLCLLWDLARKTSFTRGVFFVSNYLLFQLVGMAMLFDVWFRHSLLSEGDTPQYRQKMHRVQRVWADYLARSTTRILALKFHVDSRYEFGDRKIILVARHTSVGDTFMPLVFASIPYEKSLGFVMKKELEWDPCIDLAVSRLDHIFITRGSVDAATETSEVGALAKSEELDGVVIFPEGTRFTQKKWAQVKKSLEENGKESLVNWMDENPNVLPPRPGGLIALMENNEDADVVFLAHRGFENARTFRDVLNSNFAGSDLYIKFWGTKFEDLPKEDSERREWLMKNWETVNAFTVAD